MDSSNLVAWATGWIHYLPGTSLSNQFMTPDNALGPATGDMFDIVSLGEGGMITMTFDAPIVDGPGFDFAVFENAFDDYFLELAFVEVSSDGTNFFRFPGTSLTPEPVPFWGAYMDATEIDGLAGKYRAGYGTPFDLGVLAGVSPQLDVHDVRYVRLVDIVGDGAALDAHGNPIYDPHPTVGSSGFDLEAVGVMNAWTPMHAWRMAHFGGEAYSAQAADDASWTGDGVPNLLKYALELDPLVPHAEMLFEMDFVQTNGAAHVRVTYERRADLPDASVHVEIQEDLKDGAWRNGPITFEERIVATNATRVVVEVVANDPVQPVQFIRLMGSRP